MAFTLCTDKEAKDKAGAGASSTITSDTTAMDNFSNQAEGKLCMDTRYDWVKNYSDVSSNYTGLLAHATSALIAMNIINYDMSGFTSRAEAQTMLDVLYDQYDQTVKLLQQKQFQEKLQE